MESGPSFVITNFAYDGFLALKLGASILMLLRKLNEKPTIPSKADMQPTAPTNHRSRSHRDFSPGFPCFLLDRLPVVTRVKSV